MHGRRGRTPAATAAPAGATSTADVELIGATSTATGLTVRAELDTETYPIGIRYTKKQVDALPITRHEFHGEWNYTLRCSPGDTPPPT